MMDPKNAVLQAIEAQDWLDKVGQSAQKAIQAIYDAAGSAGIKLRDLVHGVWLGHPLHPLLTDIPIGAWSTAAVLDLVEMTTGQEEIGAGSDLAIKVGIAGASAAAVAGLTDYMHVGKEVRKYGALHAILNTTALGLYVTSLGFAGSKDRRARWGFALAGLAATGLAGYLGGHMVFDQKIGVNHAPEGPYPRRFTPVAELEDLPDGKPFRVELDTVAYVLVRRGRKVYALAETCAHLGGPLADGEVGEDNSIICPWHGSRFALDGGQVLEGPSTYAQPCLQTKVRNGMVELRKTPETIP